MTEPIPEYADSPFASQVHTPRPKAPLSGMDEDTVRGLREKLISSILQIVIQALTGAFIPGGGIGGIIGQLESFAAGIPFIGDLLDAPFISDLLDVLSGNGDFLDIISNPVQVLIDALIEILSGIPVFGAPLADLLDEFDGLLGQVDDTTAQADDTAGDLLDFFDIFGGATTPGGAGNWITDLFGLIGSPTGMGTGTPTPNAVARIPIVGGLLNGLFGGFLGIFDQDATQAQVGEAAEGIANSVAGANAAILQISAGLGTGTTDSDDFEFSNGSSWGANWRIMKSASGTASVDGHNAVFTATYTADEEIRALRLLKLASGDFQTVQVACATAGGNITDGNAATDLWLRCTNFTTYATATGLRMRFWANKALELHWFNAGTGTLITSGTSPIAFSATTTFGFEAGSSFNTRKYIAKVNNTPVIDFTDSTDRGLGNKYRGCGLRGEFSLLFFPPLEMQPPKLKQWTATG